MINYDLKAFEKAFAFQIKSQDPAITSYLQAIGGTFHASNGWKVVLSKVPEINVFSKTIYVRGTNSSKDLRIDRTWNLPSNSYRDTVIKEVSDAISEIISSATRRGQTYIAYYPYEYYEVFGVSYFTPEVKATPKFRIDSEGWGNNKLDPSKTTFLN